jgi:hypothetical protein
MPRLAHITSWRKKQRRCDTLLLSGGAFLAVHTVAVCLEAIEIDAQNSIVIYLDYNKISF